MDTTKLDNIKLTASRLARFERELGVPLTQLDGDSIGMNAVVCLFKVAGLTEKEIDDYCDTLGIEEFGKKAMEALMRSGLFRSVTTKPNPEISASASEATEN